nr:MAG TPA_asm: hypothetical protein [Caudoviricetes sp.]
MQKHLKSIMMTISVILVIIACVWISDHRRQRAEQELREQLNGLKLQYAPAERDTIRDSVTVITQQVLQMKEEEYKLQAYDRQLLHDLDIRLGQVMADQRTSLSSADTVKTDRSDSVYTYCDRWLSFRLNTADSILTYKARDSLQTIVYRQYKHRFLWWRWGTKGYDVKVINFNPHSNILYNSYIQVTR